MSSEVESVERDDLAERWKSVSSSVLEQATHQALDAFGRDLGVDQAVGYLREYYDPSSDYAGELFLSVKPSDDLTFGAADFWAVSTLNVGISRYSARRLMGPGAVHNEIKKALREIEPTRTLWTVYEDLGSGDDRLLESMAAFYRSVKIAIAPSGKESSSNRWVTASKLCARKRPALFPIRDRVVCTYLGILELDDFAKDWRVFHHLITHPEVKQALRRTRGAYHADRAAPPIDFEDLRLLDAVLWMHEISAGKVDPPEERDSD